MIFVFSNTDSNEANASNAGVQPRASTTQSFTNNHYQTSYMGITGVCNVTNGTEGYFKNVQAITSSSNKTVMIVSKSYTATGSNNGSGGSSGYNSVTASYQASSEIKRVYQEHHAPTVGNTLYVTLYMP